MKEMSRMVITLTILCFISGASLSFLKDYTQPLIEAQELNKVQGPAIQTIFPEYSNNPIAERKVFTLGDDSIVAFPIKKGGVLTGVAFERTNPGYGGPLGAMVGFNLENDSIVGVAVTSFKETPGYGSRVYEEEAFGKQFNNLPVSDNLSSVNTLSGATVSSTSFITSVKNATDVYRKLKAQFTQQFN